MTTGPFTNIPPTIETEVEFISDTIKRCESSLKQSQHSLGASTNGADDATTRNGTGPTGSRGSGLVEVTPEAEDGWTAECEKLCEGSLFKKADSWIFGANVPGKKHAVMFYFGGLGGYRAKLKEVIGAGYRGFKAF